jgi:pimeloyl-ACP methyl ester carboxylesterase
MGAADGSVFTRNRVTVGEYEIQYLRGGRGRPLVYLHGLGGGGRWESYHMALANDTLAYAPQLPGWQEYSPPESVRSVSDYADIVLQFLDAIEVDRIVLAGHSIGAWIALRVALEHPDRIERLILADSLGVQTPDAPAVDLGALDQEAFGKLLLARLGTIATANPYGFGAEFTNARTSPEFERQWKGRGLVAALVRGSYTDPKLMSGLDRVGAETLVVWGDRDGIAPVTHARLLRDSIPNARLVFIEDAGHLPMVERREAFHRVCRDFLVGVREEIPGTVDG